MKMKQSRQYRYDLRAKAFGDALRKGIMEDGIMRACFEFSHPLSKNERKLQEKMEKLLDEGCQKKKTRPGRESKLRGEASRRALMRGLILEIKTE